MDKYFLKIDKKISRSRIVLLFILVIICSVYVGNILFGKSSLGVLMRLESQEDSLKREVNYFLENNSKLQKEYFELKNLES